MAMKLPQPFRRVTKSWDEFWAEFWRIRLVKDDELVAWKNQQVVEFCIETLKLKPGMRLLDLGCGAGFQANLLAEQGMLVEGIDISKKLTDFAAKDAKKRKLSSQFRAGDMRTVKAHEEYERVLVLGMSFGFGTDAENVQTARNIYRALKPGGMAIITGQHPYSASNQTGPEWMECAEGFLVHRGVFDPLTSRLGGEWELIRPDGTIVCEGANPEAEGVRCYSAPELKNLLESIGFIDVNFYGSWLLPPSELQWFSPEMITIMSKPRAGSEQRKRK
jgi:SAM-dependent methyltransferase